MAPVAILVHGAGSTPDAAARLLALAVPAGARVLAVDAHGALDDVVGAVERAAHGQEVALAAGISLGAHALAVWAASTPPPRLALVMPAWTGEPDDVATLTAASARRLAAEGVAPTLAELPADDWVADELRRAWTGADATRLAADLAAAAGSRGPTPEELGLIRSRTAVVALADDPLHPERVAWQWARLVPGGRLAVVGRHEPGTDRGVLGRVAAALLARRAD